MTSKITTERLGHVFAIGVSRAEKRNAFDLETIDGLAEAYEVFADDAELRVAVVFAHGAHFSAGLDLAEVGPKVAADGPQTLAGNRRYDPFGVWRPQVPKPVVMAVQKVLPTVVNIATEQIVRVSDPFEPFFNDFFLGTPVRLQRQSVPLGSGVIVDPAGLLITNNHVVRRASNIEIRLFSGQTCPARLVAADSTHDLALLQITNLPAFAFTCRSMARKCVPPPFSGVVRYSRKVKMRSPE